MDMKQSQFIEVNEVPEDSYFPVFGNGVNRRVSKDNVFEQIKKEKISPFIYPTTELLQSADLRADEDFPTYVRVEETGYLLYKITNIAAGTDDITLENGFVATMQIEKDHLLVDLVSDIAPILPRLSVGDVIETKGCLSIGVGDGAFDVVTSTSLPVDGYSVIGSGPYAVLRPTNGHYNVMQFGARGNDSTDDTAAIQRAFAKSFVYFPAGNYVITGSITVTSSRLSIKGDGTGISRIKPTVFSGDIFSFTNSQITRLFISGISIETSSGDKTNGATLAFSGTVTNAYFNNIYIRHYYDAFRFDSDINKVYFSWITLDQFGRTIETYGNYSFNFVGKPVDVHMIGIQGSGFSSGSVDPNKLRGHFKMAAVDGLYVTNSHFFYADQTVIFEPTGTDIASSCSFDSVYFDSCRLNHVAFLGSTTGAYQDMKFNTCTFRDAIAGPSINVNVTGSSVDYVRFTNCSFRDNYGAAISDTQAVGNLIRLGVSNCTFDGNNIQNLATGGDIVTRGDSAVITGNNHVGGGALGSAVYFLLGSNDNILTSSNMQNSTAIKVTNSGTNNRIMGVLGYRLRNTGTTTITNPSVVATVNHGLAITPSIANIVVSYTTASAGVSRYWVSNITSTSFDINVNATPTTTASFVWSVNAEW